MTAVSLPGNPEGWTRSLLHCGLAAGPLFVAAFLAEGAVREGYSPRRHPVSSLALGSRGWIQTGNFAVTGALVLAGAAGLSRAAGQPTADGPTADGPTANRPAAGRAVAALIGTAGAGLLGAAAFVTDPVSGYPPGTPDALTHPSRRGIIHNLSAIPVFLGLPAAALSCGWRSWRAGQRAFGLTCAGTAAAMLAGIVLAGAGFGQSPRLAPLAGLFQRVSIITGFAWLTAVFARALRRATVGRCV